MSVASLTSMRAAGSDSAGEASYAWVIVGVATACLALGFGANIVISVFMKPLEDEFGWLRADTSMAYTMNAIGQGRAASCGAVCRTWSHPGALVCSARLRCRSG